MVAAASHARWSGIRAYMYLFFFSFAFLFSSPWHLWSSYLLSFFWPKFATGLQCPWRAGDASGMGSNGLTSHPPLGKKKKKEDEKERTKMSCRISSY